MIDTEDIVTETMEDSLFFGDYKEPNSYPFYDGTTTLFFDEEEHEYTRYDAEGNQVIVPGVTTITHIIDKSCALIPWAVKLYEQFLLSSFESLCDKELRTITLSEELFNQLVSEGKLQHKIVKEDAADIGSQVHNWIEKFIQDCIDNHDGEVPDLDPALPEDERVRNGCTAALAWMREHHVVWVCTERKIYSRMYDYAGTMDALAWVDGVLCVVDWKTGNYLYRVEHGMQTAAYQQAQEEELGLEIQGRWVIRIDKNTGKFQPMEIPAEDFPMDLGGFLNALCLSRSVKRIEQVDRDRRAAAKAAKKAEKEAAKAAEKEEKARIKAEKAAARAAAPKGRAKKPSPAPIAA